MGELIMSTIQKTKTGSDSLSDTGSCRASSTVIFSALELIGKSRPCSFSKHIKKLNSSYDAQEEIQRQIIRAKIAYFFKSEDSNFFSFKL